MISLDAPQALSSQDLIVNLKGWCNARKRPRWANVHVGGSTLPAAITPAPEIDTQFPHLQAIAYECRIDFRDVYKSGTASYSRDLFAITVIIENDHETRGFEYIVPTGWIDRVFDGCSSKPTAKPRTPDHLMIRVSGSSDMAFYPTGHIAVQQIRDLLKSRRRRLDDFAKILDFGCGCARVLLAMHNERVPARLYGSDIDKEAVQWCRENFAAAGEFDATEALPPTRYADNTFDLVYAISVFTHLPEDHQFAWLAELKRIMKPSGLLIATIHGPTTRSFLPPDLQCAVRKRGFLYVDQSNKDWPSYLGAKTEGLPDFYRLTYHTFDYILERWSGYFHIIDIKEQGLNFMQDAVVCCKTGDTHPSMLLPARLRLRSILRRLHFQ